MFVQGAAAPARIMRFRTVTAIPLALVIFFSAALEASPHLCQPRYLPDRCLEPLPPSHWRQTHDLKRFEPRAIPRRCPKLCGADPEKPRKPFSPGGDRDHPVQCRSQGRGDPPADCPGSGERPARPLHAGRTFSTETGTVATNFRNWSGWPNGRLPPAASMPSCCSAMPMNRISCGRGTRPPPSRCTCKRRKPVAPKAW